MKKGIIVLLITVLVAGMAFAGFSGGAYINLGVDLHNKNYGFIDQGTYVTVDLALEQALGSATGEGAIKASIDGSLSFEFSNGAYSEELGVNGIPQFPYIQAVINSATISGENWSVSILGAGAPKDFAKSAIDSYLYYSYNDYGYYEYYTYLPYSYSFGYSKYNSPIPGVEVSYNGYTAGLGLSGSYGEGRDSNYKQPNFLAYVYTPEYEVADGLKVNLGVAGFKNVTFSKEKPSDKEAEQANPASTVGGSVKVAYASDAFNASVASDMGYDLIEKAFNLDAAAKIAIAPISLDVYFKNNATTYKTTKVTDETKSKEEDKWEYEYVTYYRAGKNLLSAKAVVDLASFNVPVKLTLTGKDLINAQNLSAKVEVSALEGLTISANGGYAFKAVNKVDGTYSDSKEWSAGAGFEYECEQFTAALSAALKGTTKVSKVTASASIESETVIPGAVVGLYWADTSDSTMNLLAKEYGQVYLACEIAF